MKKRLAALTLAIMLFLSGAAGVFATQPSPTDVSATDVSGADAVVATDVSYSDRYSEPQEMRDITAAELVSEINLGWNLGESLDAWSSDAGYDDYYNANAYQLILRYDDADNTRCVSIPNVFTAENTATFTWQTGLIDSDPQIGLGQIGFEIWNLTVEHETTVTVNCTEALLTRRNDRTVSFEELLGEHTITISKYGTGALLTKEFSDDLTRTYGITDGTFKVTVELVDFPQKEYGKPQYFETLWNNPLTTYDTIKAVKAAGFNAVRVPVTYFNHTTAQNIIDAGWLNRVAEVVDYVIDLNMYCILDMQNDGSTTGWLKVNTSSSDAVTDKFGSLWTQIAERFKNYDERLLFQCFNELTDEANTWTYPGDESIEWVNDRCQQFVDAVRATGANNASRCLVLAPYAGSYEQEMINGFSMPSDSAQDRLIVSVNAYVPADFTWTVDTADTSYTDVVSWGDATDKAELDNLFDSLNKRFVNRGTPVIIGEFASADKENTSARAQHAAYYVSSAARYDIACFWWDTGDLLLRRALTWSMPEIVNAMVDATSRHLRFATITVGPAYYTGEPVEPTVTVTWAGNIVSNGDVIPSGEITPVAGVDYDVTYEKNIELGKGKLTVAGKGKYSGLVELEFEITETPRASTMLDILAKSDHDLPLIIMLSIPIIIALACFAAYQTMQRKERERVTSIVSASMEEEFARKYGTADDSLWDTDADSHAPYEDDDDLDDGLDGGFGDMPGIEPDVDQPDDSFDDDLD